MQEVCSRKGTAVTLQSNYRGFVHFRLLLVAVLTLFATGATANQIVYQLQITGMSNNGYSYMGSLDFNTSTFAAFNASFTVTKPDAGVITMNYQAPVPENYSTWCDAPQNPWCDLTGGYVPEFDQYMSFTYLLVADRPGSTGPGLYDEYAMYFWLNDLDPLSPMVAVLADTETGVFHADWRQNANLDDPLYATEYITLLGSYEIESGNNLNVIPEPASLALMGLGLAGLGLSSRKSKQQ